MAGVIEIIVEDGTGLNPLANSYVSREDAVAYAAARGVTIANATDDEQDALSAKLIRAMDYLASYENNWLGKRAVSGQPLAWPRNCVVLYGDDWPSDTLPVELERAQSQLVLEQANGIDLSPTVVGYAVKREKVGPIETEYDTAAGITGAPKMSTVDTLLRPLVRRSGYGFANVYRG